MGSGILWHTLAYPGILWNTLAYSGILLHRLAYTGILLHTLAYSGILWHTLAYSGIINASLITADGAYHCPVGSIWPFFSKYSLYLILRCEKPRFWIDFINNLQHFIVCL